MMVHAAPGARLQPPVPCTSHHASRVDNGWHAQMASSTARHCPHSHKHDLRLAPSVRNRCIAAHAVAASPEVEAAPVQPRAAQRKGVDWRAQGRLQRQVVLVRTQHCLPNCVRPWESGTDVDSSATAFVLCPRRRLLMTTAGAVEAARRVVVCRNDRETEYKARVVAVCTDADVAILTVDMEEDSNEVDRQEGERLDEADEGQEGRGVSEMEEDGDGEEDFWEGLLATEWGPLPKLQDRVFVAGFSIGGESLAVTAGVVSRCEVVEYSHSSRALLALQVDAPLNNGTWGGPCFDSRGCVLGMAHQKFTRQTWMERYDEEGLEAFEGGQPPGFMDDDSDEEETPTQGPSRGRGSSEDDDSGGGGGRGDDDEGDEGVENVGYCVPAMLLAHVVQNWEQRLAARQSGHGQAGEAAHIAPDQGTFKESERQQGAGVQEDGQGPHQSTSQERQRNISNNPLSRQGGQTHPHTSPGSSEASQALVSSPVPGPGPPMDLEGMPYLGLRYQALEAPALRAHLGLGSGESGVLITAVDPAASCAGLVQPGDVLTFLGGIQVANDGTVALRAQQRVLFGYLSSTRHVGEHLPAALIRGGQRLEVKLRLVAPPPLIPTALGFATPLYFTVAGAVFVQMTLPMFYTLELPRSKGRKLPAWGWGHLGVVAALEWGMPTKSGGEQIVVLTELLGGSVAREGFGPEMGGLKRLASVCGQPVLNVAHLAHIVVAATTPGSSSVSTVNLVASTMASHTASSDAGASTAAESDPSHGHCDLNSSSHAGFLTLGFTDGSIMVLDVSSAAKDTSAALAQHGMSVAMSRKLRETLGAAGLGGAGEGSEGRASGGLCVWPAEAGDRQGPALQKRQQKRRLAMRRG